MGAGRPELSPTRLGRGTRAGGRGARARDCRDPTSRGTRRALRGRVDTRRLEEGSEEIGQAHNQRTRHGGYAATQGYRPTEAGWRLLAYSVSRGYGHRP